MKTIYSVILYIYNGNSLFAMPFIIIRAAFFVIYQRLTGKKISTKLYNGKEILLFPFCQVSSMFYYVSIPDKEEILLLRKHADANTIFIDIGANIGSYSVMMMDCVKNIIAFEPHPVTAARCKMNFLLNGYDENKVKQIALTDENGKVMFSNYGNGSSVNKIVSDTENIIMVEAKTLDSYFDNTDNNTNDNYLIKIDVEGLELNVINGASRFLQTQKIKGIIFECFEENIEVVKNKLICYGFEICKISENNYFASRKLIYMDHKHG